MNDLISDIKNKIKNNDTSPGLEQKDSSNANDLLDESNFSDLFVVSENKNKNVSRPEVNQVEASPNRQRAERRRRGRVRSINLPGARVTQRTTPRRSFSEGRLQQSFSVDMILFKDRDIKVNKLNYIDIIKNEEFYYENTTNSFNHISHSSLHKMNEFSKLTDFITYSANKIKDIKGIEDDNLSFEISSMKSLWLKNNSFQMTRQRTRNCLYTALMLIDGHDKYPIGFYNPMESLYQMLPNDKLINIAIEKELSFGDLLIFPSWLEYSIPYNAAEETYIIKADIVPVTKSLFGDNYYYPSYKDVEFATNLNQAPYKSIYDI